MLRLKNLFWILLLVLSPGCDSTIVINSIYHNDRLMWDHINRTKPMLTIHQAPGGVVIPHHTITASAVARFYSGLSKKISPETIFILSPNHFETGGHSVVTGDNISFDTVYGSLETDKKTINELVKNKLAHVHNKTFIKEHGIFFHAPFIKKHFPQAKIVPLLLMWDNDSKTNDRLAEFILKQGSKKNFIIASVDFSHYQPKAVADFHDETSFHTILNFRFDRIDDLEVDSPSSLYVLLKIMQGSGYRQGKRFFHTNSDTFMGRREKETTSHQYFGFFKGEVKRLEGISIFLSGNISIPNDSLFLRSEWKWNRDYKSGKDRSIEKYLKNIRGVEDRFLTGADLYIFDMEETNSPRIMNAAGQKVAVIKFKEMEMSLKKQKRIIGRLKNENDFLVVIYQYEKNKSTSNDTARFHAFIDAGADLVSGKGCRPVRKEIYRNRAIFYSLGDFIAEGKNRKGEMAGVVLKKNSCKTYFFPVSLKDRYPAYEGVFDPPQ